MQDFEQDEFFEGSLGPVVSKRVVHEVRDKLLRLLNGPHVTRAMVTEGFGALMCSPKTAVAVDGAIQSVPDENVRKSLAEMVLCAGDSETAGMLGRASGIRMVAVGAYFDGEVPTRDARELREIVCGGEETYLGLPHEDDKRPGVPGLVVVIPAYDMRLMSLGLFNAVLTLGSPNIPGGQQIEDEWDIAVDCPAILFTFALDPSDCRPAETAGASAAWEFSGAYYEQCMNAVMARIAAVNKAHPDARLTAQPAARFALAIQPIQEAALAKELQGDLIAATAEYLELLAEREKHGEGHKNGPWNGRFNAAYISTATWADEMTQTAEILFVNEDAPSPAYHVRYRISPLSTVESLKEAIAPALEPLGLRAKSLPSDKGPVAWPSAREDDRFRDVDGRWLPVRLLARPQEARSLVRSEVWRMTLVAGSEDEYEEMARWPFPFLYRAMDVPKLLNSHFSDEIGAHILDLCTHPGLSFTQAEKRLLDRFPGYRDLAGTRPGDPKAVEDLRVPYEMYLSHHFHKSDGRVFHVRNALVERLEFSDIEEGVPVRYMRAPFPDCYFHLETPVVLGEGGGHLEEEVRVVGYFVTQRDIAGPGSGTRVAIAMIVTEGDDMLSSCFQEVELEVGSDDRRGLLEAINDLRAAYNQTDPITKDDAWYQAINLCAKILLYLGLRSARLVDRPERTRALERSKGKAGSEKKRVTQRAAGLYDFIEVGPERTMRQEHADAVRERGEVYWRRGFFRMQAYGTNWSLHREQWIEPTLVNADANTNVSDVPRVKDYRVGGSPD